MVNVLRHLLDLVMGKTVLLVTLEISVLREELCDLVSLTISF